MPLTTKIYKSFVDILLRQYAPYDAYYPFPPNYGSDRNIRPVQYPLVYPYNLDNGKYVAYLKNASWANIGSPVYFVAHHFDINTVTKKTTMIILPTTFTWLALAGASVARIVISQIIPDYPLPIACAIIDFGGSYVVDKDLILDFTNSGFISFDSSNYI